MLQSFDEWNEENNEQRLLLPETNYNFPDGSVISILAGEQRSEFKRIQFMAGKICLRENIIYH